MVCVQASHAHQICIPSVDGMEFLLMVEEKLHTKKQNLFLRSLDTLFSFPIYAPGRKGQRWTVQTCLTCQRSQRFLNDPKHLLWGDRPEAQLENQAGERWYGKRREPPKREDSGES